MSINQDDEARDAITRLQRLRSVIEAHSEAQLRARIRRVIERLYEIPVPEHDEDGNPLITPAAAMRERAAMLLREALGDDGGKP